MGHGSEHLLLRRSPGVGLPLVSAPGSGSSIDLLGDLLPKLLASATSRCDSKSDSPSITKGAHRISVGCDCGE